MKILTITKLALAGMLLSGCSSLSHQQPDSAATFAPGKNLQKRVARLETTTQRLDEKTLELDKTASQLGKRLETLEQRPDATKLEARIKALEGKDSAKKLILTHEGWKPIAMRSHTGSCVANSFPYNGKWHIRVWRLDQPTDAQEFRLDDVPTQNADLILCRFGGPDEGRVYWKAYKNM